MQKVILSVLLTVIAIAEAHAGGPLPQFDYQNFLDWTYENGSYALTSENISMNRIVIFGNRSLTSPEFDCGGMDSIKVRLQYVTEQFSDAGFDLDKVTVELALLDGDNNAVSFIPMRVPKKTSRQYLNNRIEVPAGLTRCRLRFTAPLADINCSGAITRVYTSLNGDLNNDCSIDVTDLSLLINVVLGRQTLDNTDIDGNGVTDVADINMLINKILNGGAVH